MVMFMLSDYDSRLIEMYDKLYTSATLLCHGKEWTIRTTEATLEFKGYKGFIDYIEEEVKCALLTYAFNKELGEIVDI